MQDSPVLFVSGMLLAGAVGYAFIIRDDLKFWAAGDRAALDEKKAGKGLSAIEQTKPEGVEHDEMKSKAFAAVQEPKKDQIAGKDVEEKKTSQTSNAGENQPGMTSEGKNPTVEDYQKLYNRIAESFDKNPDFDDGSYAPTCLRLAWHSSGTYDVKDKKGGSNGATMRFPEEAQYPANAGLNNARDFLNPFKKEFPWISYADLWTLGGVCAIQEMGGPVVPWRPGRVDLPEDETHANNLPDGTEDADRVRSLADRLGFNAQEMTALIGAHAMGRCHRQNSGYDGPWTHSPTSFTNAYYTELLEEKWKPRDWDGPFQYQDPGKELMMLPADYALNQDTDLREIVKRYADDDDAWREDFSKAFKKLVELGVPEDNFNKAAKAVGVDGPISFKSLADQENESRAD
ncbi:cytochrome-c peroxidase [Malassezia psittaci]|uniref:Peroxidase n=1 Tax=Malassezia psittaci TaxID=1821823 RepID=A0AAF0F3L1_9BASI|nr:cytochrome-c peroxidase [Malassezia psittaci]